MLATESCAHQSQDQIGRRISWEDVFALQDGQPREQVLAVLGDPQVEIHGTNPSDEHLASPVLSQYAKERIQISSYFSGDLETTVKFTFVPFVGVMPVIADAKVSHMCFVDAIFIDGRLEIEELDTRLLSKVQDGMTAAQLRRLLGNPIAMCDGWFYFTQDGRGKPVSGGRNIVRIPFRFGLDGNKQYTLSGWRTADGAGAAPGGTTSQSTRN
jgi:outer membrane protein assembly factor BamE (lipoprotein component of BamABCDE complex)